MTSGQIIALELGVVLGGVVGLAVWDLWRLRGDLRMRAESGDEPTAPDSGPESAP